MSNFGLIKSFDIDDGQLDGCSQQECFVLGYELALIDHLLKEPAPISRPVNAGNRERIEKSCKESGRDYRLYWMVADESETWMQLEVAPL